MTADYSCHTIISFFEKLEEAMKTNKPMLFDLGLVNSVRVNKSAVEARAQTLGTRRTFKAEAQAAAYLRAVQCLDLTTLAGDDTPGKVERLCVKALRPIDPEIIELLGLKDFYPTVAAVCVYYSLIEPAVAILQNRIPFAVVSTGFSAGQIPIELKIKEIEFSLEAGAKEIDAVISRSLALTGQWRKLFEEIKTFRETCGDSVKLKTILGVGNLGTLENVAKAAAVAIMAGSDFIKTSTGFEPINATLEAGLVMAREIRRSGLRVGFKPAGGIRAAKEAMLWMILMLEELGEDWTKPELFRIGASSLLTDLERQLWYLATGHYSAAHHHAMG